MLYVRKTLPILASVASSLSPLSSFIFRPNNRLFLYGVSYNSLIFFPIVFINPSFLGYPMCVLWSLHPQLVNNLFYFYLSTEFHEFCIVYTDGLVSSNSAGFPVFIPNHKLSFSDWLSHFIFSFSAEGYAIIQSFLPNKFLVVSNS